MFKKRYLLELHLGNLSEMPFCNGHFHHTLHFCFYVCDTNVSISFTSRYYTFVMSKPAENKFYSETLLTLNANSSDDYVKSIYDDIAEKYDKVSCILSLKLYFYWLK